MVYIGAMLNNRSTNRMTDDDIKNELRTLANQKRLSEFSRFSGIALPTMQGILRSVTNREDGKREMTKYTREGLKKSLKKWGAKNDLRKD